MDQPLAHRRLSRILDAGLFAKVANFASLPMAALWRLNCRVATYATGGKQPNAD